MKISRYIVYVSKVMKMIFGVFGGWTILRCYMNVAGYGNDIWCI